MICPEEAGRVECWSLKVAVGCCIVAFALLVADAWAAIVVAALGLAAGLVALSAQRLRFRREVKPP